MAARRQHGTGSVYQRASDGRWVGSVEAGITRNGSRRRVVVTGKSKVEVQRKLATKRRLLDREGIASSRRVTVNAWMAEWLEVQAHRLRPKTWTGYRAALVTWVRPTIGHVALGELTPKDIRSVAAAQRASGRSSSTLLKTHAVLVKMLKDARREGHAVPLVVTELDRPQKATADREGMLLEQALAVLAVVAQRADASRWVAALLQGMRQGECLGLTWSCVDLEAGQIDVSWQLQSLPYVRARDPRSGFRIPDGYEVRQLVGAKHLVRPKTARGQRIIPLVPWMASALAQWRESAPDSPFDLVWAAKSGPRTRQGDPLNEKADLAEWKAIQDQAGVRHPTGRHYVTHEARHTTATLLMELGIDPHVREQIMGHSSITVTRGYEHVSQALARDALTRVADVLQLGR